MTQYEKQQLLNEQYNIIHDREARLLRTDYVANKIAEGAATREEYAEKLTQRQAWRADINAAQDEIERLEAIEVEEPEVQVPDEETAEESAE